MDAGDINHALNVQFERYDYRLNNSYIFAWESDFLCLSSGGYWVEIVRRAPYLHKRKMDLTKILLNKYYNLWRFKAECDKYTACIECKLF